MKYKFKQFFIALLLINIPYATGYYREDIGFWISCIPLVLWWFLLEYYDSVVIKAFLKDCNDKYFMGDDES